MNRKPITITFPNGQGEVRRIHLSQYAVSSDLTKDDLTDPLMAAATRAMETTLHGLYNAGLLVEGPELDEAVQLVLDTLCAEVD